MVNSLPLNPFTIFIRSQHATLLVFSWLKWGKVPPLEGGGAKILERGLL